MKDLVKYSAGTLTTLPSLYEDFVPEPSVVNAAKVDFTRRSTYHRKLTYKTKKRAEMVQHSGTLKTLEKRIRLFENEINLEEAHMDQIRQKAAEYKQKLAEISTNPPENAELLEIEYSHLSQYTEELLAKAIKMTESLKYTLLRHRKQYIRLKNTRIQTDKILQSQAARKKTDEQAERQREARELTEQKRDERERARNLLRKTLDPAYSDDTLHDLGEAENWTQREMRQYRRPEMFLWEKQMECPFPAEVALRLYCKDVRFHSISFVPNNKQHVLGMFIYFFLACIPLIIFSCNERPGLSQTPSHRLEDLPSCVYIKAQSTYQASSR